MLLGATLQIARGQLTISLATGAMGIVLAYLPETARCRARQLKFGIRLIVTVLLLATFLSPFPAQAQLLGNAETFMTGLFPDSSEAVELIFGFLRGIYLIYIAYSGVQIVNAAREGEDYLTMARMPVLVAVAVPILDVVTGLITGEGVGG